MLTTEIEFTFIAEPPTKEEVEANLFTVMLDLSGLEDVAKPLVLQIMRLVQKKSRERGARYTFALR